MADAEETTARFKRVPGVHYDANAFAALERIARDGVFRQPARHQIDWTDPPSTAIVLPVT